MNWLSQKEIKRRAEISDEEALNVSIEHWEQICEAANVAEGSAGHDGADDCGLCYRYQIDKLGQVIATAKRRGVAGGKGKL